MSNMLTLPEAAEKLRLSKSTVYHLTSDRAIPFYKIGQRVLFDAEELENWVQAHRVTPIAGRANKCGMESEISAGGVNG